MSRVVLAMSGGVDSSVSAYLLRQMGHEVIGVFMRHGEAPSSICATTGQIGGTTLPVLQPRLDHKQGCCSASDAEDARRVADELDIPFYAIDFQEDFRQIIDYFVDEYTRARTPNPCVMCNNWIKFGRLFDYADSLGAQHVATGHYARIMAGGFEGEPPALCRGVDGSKDQSYVLFGIAPDRLRRMLLPVGDYCKDEIRGIARTMGLRVADKKDSQEICFVPHGGHADFIRRRTGGHLDTAGEIVTTDGHVVGHHAGLEQFTIGQRKGLGIALGEPRYVVRLERETRRVVLGTKRDLARTEFTASRTNWLVRDPRDQFKCSVKIRYNGATMPATAEILPGERLHILFDQPQCGVAPGQAVVCYDGDRVLGGGWID